MDDRREAQLAVWEALARGLGEETPLLEALQTAAGATAAPLAGEVERLAAALTEGVALEAAFEARPEVWTPTMTQMVRAGLAGGVLDIIARRLAEGLRDGSLRVPGEAPDPADDPVRCWRLFGRLLGSGVPLPAVLRLLGEELVSEPMRRWAAGLEAAISAGEGFGEALAAARPALHPEALARLLAGEASGELDRAASQLAEELAAGRLLPDPEASAAPAAGADDVGSPAGLGDDAASTFVRRLLREALEQRISDVHLEPTADGRGRVRIRRDGRLVDAEPPPEGLFSRIVGRIKLLSALDVAERRLPQDGRISGRSEAGEAFDVRVATVPAHHGERMTLRLLDGRNAHLELEQLELGEALTARLRELTARRHGFVLVAGPTGSGKTTVLFSLVRSVDREARCVVSAEAPVHYVLEGVSQVAVRPQYGLTYAAALRALMRQDPDVVMIGETRDPETLQRALEAATTGHLVLSQMHADSAAAAVRLMLDIGVEPFELNAALAAVVGIRLVRRLCPDCRVEADAPEPSGGPPELEAWLAAGGRAFAPRGCEACAGSGYRGRIPIVELLEPGQALRQAVAAGAGLDALERAARADGMRSLLETGLARAAEGLTSLEELRRLTG